MPMSWNNCCHSVSNSQPTPVITQTTFNVSAFCQARANRSS